MLREIKALSFLKKVPWFAMAIIDALIVSAVFYIVVAVLAMLNLWPSAWAIPWEIIVIALILIGLLFEFYEKKQKEKKR